MNIVDELDKIRAAILDETAATYDLGRNGTENQTVSAIGKMQGLDFALTKISALRNKLSAPTTGAE